MSLARPPEELRLELAQGHAVHLHLKALHSQVLVSLLCMSSNQAGLMNVPAALRLDDE